MAKLSEQEVRLLAKELGIDLDVHMELDTARELSAQLCIIAESRKRYKNRPTAVRIGYHLRSVFRSIGLQRESPIEDKLCLAMNASEILEGQFQMQKHVGPYRLDFSFIVPKLCVEADGYAYHTEPAQIERDQSRDIYMTRLGWTVLRFTGSDIYSRIEECVTEVESVFQAIGG